MLIAASIWVSGPVLLKLLSDVHISSRIAFLIACTVLILFGLSTFRAQSRSRQWLPDLTNFVCGIAMLGAVPALIIGGVLQTDAVSVALIGGLFIFLVPALAWLLRKQELDGGFFLVLVFASTGTCTLLYGRIRWAEATILGNLMLTFGIVCLVFSFMRNSPSADRERVPWRAAIVQITGAALFFTGLTAVMEFNWFSFITADDFPLMGMLAASFAAYWSTTYWSSHDFNWQEWPILFLAALFPIGVVLGTVLFDEAPNTGEMICVGLVTIFVATAHWLRRWVSS